MNTRITENKYIPLSNGKHLETAIYYCKGGMNYFTYKQVPRCYFLSLEIVEIVDLGDRQLVKSTPLSGTSKSVILLETKRNTPKTRKEAIAKASEIVNSQISDLLSRNGIQA